jgi:hypothetical protein
MALVLPRREMALFALLGFGVWLSGAVMFRFGGHLMFESGPWVLVLSGVGVAISVCLLLNATMAWRRAPSANALSVAVAMALPGLFGDVLYVLAFAQITGLEPFTAAPFAAVLILGNANLLAYALFRSCAAA